MATVGYYINGYWLFMVIILMVIGFYSIIDYCWLLLVIILLVIGFYSIIDYCWLLY
jgi:hypothetical protein